jgi:hypothetical protein
MSTHPLSPEDRARLYRLAYRYASTWMWSLQQNRYVTQIDGLTTTDVAAAISQENSALAADYWVRAALALVDIAEDRLAQAHARDKTERTFDSLLDLSDAQDVVSSTAETLHQLTELARVARDREHVTTDNQIPDTAADPDPDQVQRMYDYLSHQSPRKPPAEVRQDAEYLVGCGYTVDDLTAFAHWAHQANAAYHHRATPGHQERHTLTGTDSDQVQRVYDYLSVSHPHHDGGELWNHAQRLVGDGYTPDELAQLDAYLTAGDTLAHQPEEIQAATSDQAPDTVAGPDPDEVQRVYDYLVSRDPHQDRGKLWDHAEHLVGLGYTAQTLTEWNAQLNAYLADEAAYQQRETAQQIYDYFADHHPDVDDNTLRDQADHLAELGYTVHELTAFAGTPPNPVIAELVAKAEEVARQTPQVDETTVHSLDAAWRVALALTHAEQVIRGDNDGHYETDRALPDADRAKLGGCVSLLSEHTGLPAGFLQQKLQEAAYAYGQAPGTDADPDYFAPPNWDALTARWAKAIEQRVIDAAGSVEIARAQVLFDSLGVLTAAEQAHAQAIGELTGQNSKPEIYGEPGAAQPPPSQSEYQGPTEAADTRSTPTATDDHDLGTAADQPHGDDLTPTPEASFTIPIDPSGDAWGAHLAAQEHLGSYLDGMTPEQRNIEREIADAWARANPEALGTVNEAPTGDPGAEPTENLTSDDQHALAHIRGRTTMGKFASGLYDWNSDRWKTAIDNLTSASYPIRYVHGTVADDPSVTGGWVLDTSAHVTPHAAVTNSQEQGSQQTPVKSKDLPTEQEPSQSHSSSRATDEGTPHPAPTDQGASPLFSAETGSGAGAGGDGIDRARRAISHLSRSLNQREGPWHSEVPTILPASPGVEPPAAAGQDLGW